MTTGQSDPGPEAIARVAEALLRHPDGSMVVVKGEWAVRCDGCGETLSSGPDAPSEAHLVFARHLAEVVLRVPLAEPVLGRPLLHLYNSRRNGKKTRLIEEILESARERGLDIRVIDGDDS